MKSYRIPLLIGVLSGLGLLVLMLNRHSEKSSQPAPASPAISAHDVDSGLSRNQTPFEGSLSPAIEPAASAEAWRWDQLPLLSEERIRLPEGYRWEKLRWAADFKYPYIRVEKTFDHQQRPEKEEAMIGDHLAVRFKPGISRTDIDLFVKETPFHIRRALRTSDDQTYLLAWSNPENVSPREMADRIRQAGWPIEYVEPDYLVFPTATTPNDPKYAQDYWALHNTGQTGGTPDADIDAPEAWDTTTGSSDVVVAIVDSGIDYNHPDLSSNIWTNPGEIAGNGIDDDGNGYIDDIRGWDFVSEDNDPQDAWLHGTHVAGTVGAVGNNGLYGAGVAWNVKLVPIRAIDFLGTGGPGVASDAAEGIAYATSIGADITTNSYGGQSFSLTLRKAIADAAEAGVLFVASSGNETRDNDAIPRFPSSYHLPNVLAVGASDAEDQVAVFDQPTGLSGGQTSNIGMTSVDLMAPGNRIYSTVPSSPTDWMSYNNFPANYHWLSGTSMAVPHVAGVAALMKAEEPGLPMQTLRALLFESVDHQPSFTYQVSTGGRLNARKALDLLPLRETQSLPVIVEVEWFENGLHGSSGDGDRALEPGETVAIVCEIHNAGTQTSIAPSLELSLTQAHPDVTLGITSLSPADLPADNGSGRLVLTLQVDSDATDFTPIDLELLATDNAGFQSARALRLQLQANDAVTEPHEWVNLPMPDSSTYRDIAFHPTNADLLFVLTRTDLFISTDGGAGWTAHGNLHQIAGSAGSFLFDLVVDPIQPQRLYALSGSKFNNGFFRSEDGGATWSLISSIHGSLLYDEVRAELIAVNGTGAFRSDDLGVTWTQAPNDEVPTFNTPDAVHYTASVDRILLGDSAGSFTPTQTTDLLIWRSVAGSNWQQASATEPRSSNMQFSGFAVDPDDPSKVFARSSFNWFASTDGAATFVETPNVMPVASFTSSDHLLYAEPIAGQPKAIFIFHDQNPGIYRSTDEGLTWQVFHYNYQYSANIVNVRQSPANGKLYVLKQEELSRLDYVTETPNEAPALDLAPLYLDPDQGALIRLPRYDAEFQKLAYQFSDPAHGTLRYVATTSEFSLDQQTILYFYDPDPDMAEVEEDTITVTVTDQEFTSTDTLTVAPLNFPLWQRNHFGEAALADPSLEATLWGESADPDVDGLNNLLEYATGGHPMEANPNPLTIDEAITDNIIIYDQGQYVDRVRVRTSLSYTFRELDVNVQLEYSTDLENWKPLPARNSDVTVIELPEALFSVEDDPYTLLFELPGPQAVFYRMNAELE